MPSLQTGLIQGGESGAIFYALTGLPREAPYLTLTRHAFDTGMYLANRDWFDSLSVRQRQHLLNSLMSAPQMRELVRGLRGAIFSIEAGALRHHSSGNRHPEQSALAWRAATAPNQQALSAKIAIGGQSQANHRTPDRAKAGFPVTAPRQPRGPVAAYLRSGAPLVYS